MPHLELVTLVLHDDDDAFRRAGTKRGDWFVDVNVKSDSENLYLAGQ